MKPMFLKEPDVDKVKADFVFLVPPGISTEEALMQAYYATFDFPYFGFNWDALYDVLRNLDWMTDTVLIRHQTIPLDDPKDQLIYLRLLADAVESWQDEGDRLYVSFPEERLEWIEQLLSPEVSLREIQRRLDNGERF